MASSRRVCINDPNSFCHICGEYIFQKYRLSVSDFVKQAYLKCCGFPLETKNKYYWVPNVVCKICVEELRLWTTKKRISFKFQSPMIWGEPLDHYENCYFCVVNISGVFLWSIQSSTSSFKNRRKSYKRKFQSL